MYLLCIIQLDVMVPSRRSLQHWDFVPKYQFNTILIVSILIIITEDNKSM